MSPLRRGFKAQAERLALQVRRDLGISPFARLDPLRLAKHLDVEVVSLTELGAWGAPRRAMRHLMHDDPKAFSAAMVCFGGDRLVVYNPCHSQGRRANSICHELSHILLGHPTQPFALAKCRRGNKLEAEATWLAGSLLLPDPAAAWVARVQKSVDWVAWHYGVSTSLVTWRLNVTGARKRARLRRSA